MENYLNNQDLKEENGSYVPIDADGNRLRNSSNSDPIKLVDHFEENFVKDYFPAKKKSPDTPGGKGVNNDKEGGGSDDDFVIPEYKSANEWSSAINSETDTKKKAKLVDASRKWEANQ